MSQKYNLQFGIGMPLLKLLVPWCDEPQILTMLSSLNKYCISSNQSVEVVIFSGYGNLEVHQLLYDEVNISKMPCVKLDGDMALIDADSFFQAAMRKRISIN